MKYKNVKTGDVFVPTIILRNGIILGRSNKGVILITDATFYKSYLLSREL